MYTAPIEVILMCFWMMSYMGNGHTGIVEKNMWISPFWQNEWACYRAIYSSLNSWRGYFHIFFTRSLTIIHILLSKWKPRYEKLNLIFNQCFFSGSPQSNDTNQTDGRGAVSFSSRGPVGADELIKKVPPYRPPGAVMPPGIHRYAL